MINEAGVTLIKAFEGCKLTAYKDAGGVWTIGWGDTDGVTATTKISQNEADLRLSTKIVNFALEVKQICSLIGFKYTENQLSALTSFRYNLGLFNLLRLFMGSEDPKGKINPKKMANKMLEFDTVEGNQLRGLLRRRLAESSLFMTKDGDNPPKILATQD